MFELILIIFIVMCIVHPVAVLIAIGLIIGLSVLLMILSGLFTILGELFTIPYESYDQALIRKEQKEAEELITELNMSLIYSAEDEKGVEND